MKNKFFSLLILAVSVPVQALAEVEEFEGLVKQYLKAQTEFRASCIKTDWAGDRCQEEIKAAYKEASDDCEAFVPKRLPDGEWEVFACDGDTPEAFRSVRYSK